MDGTDSVAVAADTGTGRKKVGRAVVIIALMYLRTLLVSWFFFKPVLRAFNGKPCLRERPYTLPSVPYWDLVKLKLLWIARIWAPQTSQPVKSWLDARHLAVMRRIEAHVEKTGTLQQQEIPLPEFDWKNGTPEEFYERFVKTPMPVVLRGYALETDAVKKWSFDHIIEKCGDVQVNLTGPESDWMGPLREVRDPTIYCANADAPFKRVPQLTTELAAHTLQPYLKRENTFNQIFIGQKATGSGYHCAGIWNFFYMIEGEKKWTFVDPELTWMMYPSIHIGVLAFTSLVSFPDRSDTSVYPLYKYAPRYSVHLKPGDVLFNPPWWWHAIDNLTPTSVAVATRWDAVRRDPSFYELNRMLSLLAVINPSFPGFLFDFLTIGDGQGGQSLLNESAGALDENVTFAPKNQKARDKNVYHGKVVEKIRTKEKW